MRQKRVLAWMVALAIMLASLLLGSYLTYRQQRNRVVNVFRQEAEPLIDQQLQLLYNMQRVYVLNNMENDDTAMAIWEIERVQQEIQHLQMGAPWVLNIVGRAQVLYAAAANHNFSEGDLLYLRNFMLDIEELQLILQQQVNYNTLAEEFNRNMQTGLAFLTHRPLPVFE